jgi:hypothetical protein
VKLLVTFTVFAVAGCSAAAADPQESYAQATACEVTTMMLGSFHPSLSTADRERYQAGFRRITKEVIELGSQLGKNLDDMDLDKRALLKGYVAGLNGPEGEKTLNLMIATADECVPG